MIQHFRESLPDHVPGYVLTDGDDTAVILNDSWIEALESRGEFAPCRRLINDLLAAMAVGASLIWAALI